MKKSIFELISRRKSWRTYLEKDIPCDVLDELKQRLQNPPRAPFGTQTKLYILDKLSIDPTKPYKLGTYGFIQGAKTYLSGVTVQGPRSMEDFGFLFEWAILEATDLDLGSCWLGGTLSRGEIAKATGLVSEKRGWVDRLVAFSAGSAKRSPFEELFFGIDKNHPYYSILEMVRLPPSASNRQPWRLFYREDQALFDFYIKRTLFYDKMTPIDLQKVDLGIAQCHFEFAAKELGLKGTWIINDKAPECQGLEYNVTWKLG